MLRLAVTVILAILGIFVHPFDPGIVDFIYRFLVFSGLIYIAYLSFKDPEKWPAENGPAQEPEAPAAAPRESLNVRLDRDWSLQELITTDDRTKEFIGDQFMVMGNLLMPDNGWVFLRHPDNTLESIRYENFSGSVSSPEHSRIALSGIFQILDNTENVLIENNLEKQPNLLSLYDDENYRVASFLGIPLHLTGEQKIFFCFDSAATEHFNQEDTRVIQRIAQGISTFVVNRLKAYTLLAQVNENNELLEFAKTLNGCKTIAMAMERLVETMSRTFEASRLTLAVLKKESGSAVIKKVVGQKDEFEENVEFPLEEGLTGWVIGKNKPYLLDDIEKGEYFIPRYTKSEKTNYGLHAFLGIPFGTDDQVLGAITLEHVVPAKYTEADKQHVLRLAQVFGTVFNRQSGG